MNLTELKSEFPQVYQEALDVGKSQITAKDIADMHPDIAKAFQEEGMKDERARISDIQQSAFEGQDDLVKELIEQGVSADEGRKRLISDQKKRIQGDLQSLAASDPGDLGANDDPDAGQPSLKPDQTTASNRREAGDKLDALAKDYMAANGVEDYQKAFDSICKQYPRLVEVYNGK